MFEKLYSLMYGNLIVSSPVLSGNMQFGIHIGQVGTTYAEIIIDAPFYDGKEWRKNKVVKHTGKVDKYGHTDYASSVNNYGAFGSHNKSEHWVNRAVYETCLAIANEVGGVVINELEL